MHLPLLRVEQAPLPKRDPSYEGRAGLPRASSCAMNSWTRPVISASLSDNIIAHCPMGEELARIRNSGTTKRLVLMRLRPVAYLQRCLEESPPQAEWALATAAGA